MERFKRATSSRYRPTAALHTTLECDAAVRTISKHRTLASLLDAHIPPTVTLTHNSPSTPLIWLEAVSRLEQTLRISHKTPVHLIDAYSNALEQVTAVSDHDHLSTPFAVFLCAWAAEPDILRSLASIAAAAKPPQDGTAASATAAYAAAERVRDERAACATPKPIQPRVLVVVREGSKQDEAAIAPALLAVQAEYGEDRTYVVRLGVEDGDESPSAIANVIATVVQQALNDAIHDVARYADKLRKASRSSFRSWFGGTPSTIPTRAVVETELSSMGRKDTSNGDLFDDMSSTDGSMDGVSNGTLGGRSRKRMSFGSGGVQTPLFPVQSLESRTRHLADLYLLAGRYTEALECYRLLQSDLRGLTGAAIVHEASACEMAALSLTLVDGPKQGIGSGIEKAIQLYCKAGRQELAMRTTLRGVAFCVEAGFPDSAAGVIIRAIDAILPKRPLIVGSVAGMAASGSAFVDGALAILHTACSNAYTALRRRRRASLYAFLASTRFAKLKLRAAAACIVRDVDEKALLRTGVRDEVELVLGAAESAEGNHARALGHFVHVMSNVSEQTDVEIQGAAIQGFLEAAGGRVRESMEKRWDSGVLFPLVQRSLTCVSTHDSWDCGDEDWKMLEDDVLEDHEFFTSLSKWTPDAPLPRRERRVESVITELRRNRELGDSSDLGGSVEMKVKRIREIAESRRKRRRAESLLERGAIVGEKVSVQVALRNPLQFPVFVTNLSAVVSLDEKFYSSVQDIAGNEDGESDQQPIEFLPMEDVTLGPCSEHRIPVEVVVQKPGTLQFLGLTWKFTIGMGGVSPKEKTIAVPGFCLLERRGRRLNSTRQQRASEVPLYEADESLTVTIAPPAPRIKADIRCLESGRVVTNLNSLSLRAGETRKARLILTNEGSIPLPSVVLRIGTPRTIFANVMPDTVANDKNRTLYAIGTDEDFAGKEEVVISSQISVNLGPKESTQIDLWLKGVVSKSALGYRSESGSKRKGTGGRRMSGGEGADGMAPCSVRMAIAYGMERVRVTRVDAQFSVHPSIVVSPRFLREADEGVFANSNPALKGVLLGLEVEHGVHTLAENLMFHVTEVSITSRRGWRPMLLQSPIDCHEIVSEELSQSANTLRINETATVFFVVVRDQADETSHSTDVCYETPGPWRTFTVNLAHGRETEKRLGDPEISSEGGTPSVLLSTSEREEHKASTHFVMNAHYGSFSSSLSGKAARGELVYVGLGWKSSSKETGEIHIPPIDPLRWIRKRSKSVSSRDGENALERSSSDASGVLSTRNSSTEISLPAEIPPRCEIEKWVSVDVRHPSSIDHNFLRRPNRPAYLSEQSVAAPYPALVAVDVVVSNLSPYLLDVVCAAPASAGIAEGDCGRYYAGDIAMSLRALPPGAQRKLTLTAMLTRPGRFNMSRFTVLFQLCGYSSRRMREQVVLQPSYLTVRSTSVQGVEDDVVISGGISPMTVMADKSAFGDGAYKGDQKVEEDGDPNAIEVEEQKADDPGRRTNFTTKQSDVEQEQRKRMRAKPSSEQLIELNGTPGVTRSMTVPGIGTTNMANVRPKQQLSSERKKPFSRARSDSQGVPYFKGSVDDALWNASDTEESDS